MTKRIRHDEIGCGYDTSDISDLKCRFIGRSSPQVIITHRSHMCMQKRCNSNGDFRGTQFL